MKKVLFVATVVQLHIERFHIPYLKWFHDQGWQVDVAARNDYEDPKDCKIPFCDHFYDLPFERSPFRQENLWALKELKKLLAREHYDIIHCHTPMGGVVARLAARKSREKGTKVLYTAHGFHFYRGAPMLNWLLYYPVERLLARWTDVIVTMNREDERRAERFSCSRSVYIPGVGVDISRFAQGLSREEARTRLGLGREEPFILSVGELIPRKNYGVALEAVARLGRKDVQFWIAGTGASEGELRAQIDRLGLREQVKLLGFRSDIPDLLHAADVFFFPSRQEGLPVALMEAMASGLPIVCSRIRGNTDLIDEGKGGYLAAPGDAEGFSRALESILDGADTAEMRAYNRQKIQLFSREAVMEQMAALYQSVMNGDTACSIP